MFNYDSLPSWFKYINIIKYNYIVKIQRSDFKQDPVTEEENAAIIENVQNDDEKQNDLSNSKIYHF